MHDIEYYIYTSVNGIQYGFDLIFFHYLIFTDGEFAQRDSEVDTAMETTRLGHGGSNTRQSRGYLQ